MPDAIRVRKNCNPRGANEFFKVLPEIKCQKLLPGMSNDRETYFRISIKSNDEKSSLKCKCTKNKSIKVFVTFKCVFYSNIFLEE